MWLHRYLLFDQVLAPLLVTDGLIRQATAPGRKKQLQNKAQLDARFIKYIRRQVKIPNGLLSFDDFVRVTVVLATYKKLEMLRLLFNLVRTSPHSPHLPPLSMQRPLVLALLSCCAVRALPNARC